jgi:predicted component of type VI protein secretion system
MGKGDAMPTLTDQRTERASQPLVVRLPKEMHEQVKRQAEERTMAQVVRRALRAYLDAAIGRE